MILYITLVFVKAFYTQKVLLTFFFYVIMFILVFIRFLKFNSLMQN